MTGKQGKTGTLEQDIYRIIESESGVKVMDIVNALKVSRETIKQHLITLAHKGKVYSKLPRAGYSHTWHAAHDYNHLWIIRGDDQNRLQRYY